MPPSHVQCPMDRLQKSSNNSGGVFFNAPNLTLLIKHVSIC